MLTAQFSSDKIIARAQKAILGRVSEHPIRYEAENALQIEKFSIFRVTRKDKIQAATGTAISDHDFRIALKHQDHCDKVLEQEHNKWKKKEARNHHILIVHRAFESRARQTNPNCRNDGGDNNYAVAAWCQCELYDQVLYVQSARVQFLAFFEALFRHITAGIVCPINSNKRFFLFCPSSYL